MIQSLSLSACFCRGAITLLALPGLSGCARPASSVPLSPGPPGSGYYYGAPAYGGRSLSAPPETAGIKPASPVPPAKTDEAVAANEEVDAETFADEDGSEPKAHPSVSPEEFAKPFAGKFVGDDRVTIRFDGLPEQVQEDDQATMRVEVEGSRVSMSVVDSNSGNDLCTVVGEPRDEQILFKAGQSCFAEMLGGPMNAELVGGTAHLADSTLTVELDVKIELRGPDDSLSGVLHYRFEGDRK